MMIKIENPKTGVVETYEIADDLLEIVDNTDVQDVELWLLREKVSEIRI